MEENRKQTANLQRQRRGWRLLCSYDTSGTNSHSSASCFHLTCVCTYIRARAAPSSVTGKGKHGMDTASALMHGMAAKMLCSRHDCHSSSSPSETQYGCHGQNMVATTSCSLYQTILSISQALGTHVLPCRLLSAGSGWPSTAAGFLCSLAPGESSSGHLLTPFSAMSSANIETFLTFPHFYQS